MRKRLIPLLSAALLAAGLWQLGSGVWLLAKAELAQYLIADAWARQLDSGEAHKPWPWADTWPVAQLRLGDQRPLFVLRGTSGQALAFGPGLLEFSPLPGEPVAGGPRTTVIAAHRDTHFRGLGQLKSGTTVQLQGRDGLWRHFRVRGTRIVDSRREKMPVFAVDGLLLVTCYPFDALAAGGPLRYLVYAEPVVAAAKPAVRGKSPAVVQL
ncbi:class GN sortase [uncultured Microbulbifer sp.]|uniref:class GN sortase n=1 Tax=uncultured Microbulbifer sp. TaxID=348147 RepID=UPI0025E9D679|nr:class GN sortase [uncultured Microbulbifer sp.]